MGKVKDIIRRYAEADRPVEGFGPWLLSERDSEEKEEALSGLWSSLEMTPAADNAFLRRAKLSALMGQIPEEKAVVSGRRWIWLLPVAAAAALGLFLLLPHAGEERPLQTPDQPMAQLVVEDSMDGVDVEESGLASVLAQGKSVAQSVKTPVHSLSRYAEVGQSEHVVLADETGLGQGETPISEPGEEVPDYNPSTDSKEDKAAVAAQWAELERQERLERQRKSRPFSLGVQSSGGLLAAASSRTMGYPSGQFLGSPGPSELSGVLPGGLAGGEYIPVEVKTRYDVPIRAGVSFVLPLDDRFSLGTGLTTTLLHSTTSLSNSSSYVYGTIETRYCYLGIPLTLRYRLASGGWGSLYGMTGFQADYLLKGWRTVRLSESEPNDYSFSKQSFQLSARVGAGYEYSIYRRWGIYAEASLYYYFKNSSSLDSYFKQQPLAPALTLGVHYTISR